MQLDVPLRPVLLDTNLFLLFVVGTADRSAITKHNRLRAYSPEVFDLLLLLLEQTSEIVVTPNTAAETSNLLRQGVKDPLRRTLSVHFASLLEKMREDYVPSSIAAAHSTFVRLGLSDAAIAHLADGDMAILTADLDLYLEAASSGRDAVNFNHVREEHGV